MRVVFCMLMGLAAALLMPTEIRASNEFTIGASSDLVNGAMAIRVGDYRRGIELTRAGMRDARTNRDRAAALSNLCAGHVGLGSYADALPLCNESLQLNDGNWRTWNNRAAAYLGMGLPRRAMTDIERGLALNPNAVSLNRLLEIVQSEIDAGRRPEGSPEAERPT